ncbi:hypothetical protein SAMN05216597_2797 [Pseudomonas cannabina]|nr:hypothetical protein SAMN05216597_2797 [Pseudomonas cannabina]
MNTVSCPALSGAFYRVGADDTECDPRTSVRAKSGRKYIQLTSQNRCVTRSATKRTQSVQNCMQRGASAR